jgi:uncharacterized membrane protein YfcA
VIGLNVYWLLRPLSAANAVGAQGRAGPPQWPAVALVGTLTGFAAGLLGIGGGAVAVPAQQAILRLGLRSAIANSAAAVIFSTLLAAVCKNATLAPAAPGTPGPWTYVLFLAPPAVVGALVGSYLTHRVGRTWLRLVFIGFLAWTAYKMLTA